MTLYALLCSVRPATAAELSHSRLDGQHLAELTRNNENFADLGSYFSDVNHDPLYIYHLKPAERHLNHKWWRILVPSPFMEALAGSLKSLLVSGVGQLLEQSLHVCVLYLSRILQTAFSIILDGFC